MTEKKKYSYFDFIRDCKDFNTEILSAKNQSNISGTDIYKLINLCKYWQADFEKIKDKIMTQPSPLTLFEFIKSYLINKIEVWYYGRLKLTVSSLTNEQTDKMFTIFKNKNEEFINFRNIKLDSSSIFKLTLNDKNDLVSQLTYLAYRINFEPTRSVNDDKQKASGECR